jgi:alkanesulfonate monooxygenase SsuD/methylene tetrahydromethanopterin reductase-like flavin-dependent oxidoreductase (luciferase family)
MTRDITIGLHLAPQQGEYSQLCDQWIAADELGVDRLWSSDHLNAVVADTEFLTNTNDGTHSYGSGLNVFEGTTIQAAMAATTSRAEIGCIVHSNSYRNPNLTAYIAGTIDHISGGRYVLGMGTGFFKPDFDEYGYEYGTQRSRSEALMRDIPIILDRLARLRPPPPHDIPLMIASMGEKIGLPMVAAYADIWHGYGPVDKMKQKIEVLKRCCDTTERAFEDIELATYYIPAAIPGAENSLDAYVAAGFTHIICVTQGPDWNLDEVHDVMRWRDNAGAPQ